MISVGAAVGVGVGFCVGGGVGLPVVGENVGVAVFQKFEVGLYVGEVVGAVGDDVGS